MNTGHICLGKSKLAPNATNKSEYWEEVFNTYNVKLNLDQIGANSTIVSVPKYGILKLIEDENNFYTQARQEANLRSVDYLTSLSELKNLDKKHHFGLFGMPAPEITVVNKHGLRFIQIVEQKKDIFTRKPDFESIDGLTLTPVECLETKMEETKQTTFTNHAWFETIDGISVTPLEYLKKYRV